jgi:branched-chain amino acid transport system ATP-binding protein
MSVSSHVLRIQNLCVRFGAVRALDGVHLELSRGSICGVVGPNGSGKTTLFNCITQLTASDHGEIEFEGRSLQRCPAHELRRLGISRTFQHQALFDSLTVREHLEVGAAAGQDVRLWARVLALPRVRTAHQRIAARIDPLLESLGLLPYAEERPAALPLALRHRVDLARALAGAPRLLLLDEPASGLDDVAITSLAQLLRRLVHEHRLTLLIIEHRMPLLHQVCDRIMAMHRGRLSPYATTLNPVPHPRGSDPS